MMALLTGLREEETLTQARAAAGKEEEEEEEEQEEDEIEDVEDVVEGETSEIEEDGDLEPSKVDRSERTSNPSRKSDHDDALVSKSNLPITDEKQRDRPLSASSILPPILMSDSTLDLVVDSPEINQVDHISSNQESTAPSNPVPTAKPHLRFFTSSSKVASAEDGRGSSVQVEDPIKTIRGPRQRSRGQDVIARKGSLHKLFSGGNYPQKTSTMMMGYKKPNRTTIPSTPPPLLLPPPSTTITLKPTILTTLPLPPVHRSFLLDCRTEILAQQFCLIERDLLRNITWQELLLSKWQERRSSSSHSGGLYHKSAGGNGHRKKKGALAVEDSVTCWESFMKQRAKEKMRMKGRIHESSTTPSPRNNGQASSTSSLTKGVNGGGGGTEINAVIMRFNLTCNWVASELVLTLNLEERVALLGKFIRLAFKCYRQNNFQTLTQIIHGLQTPYVARLKKTWSKLGIWESRMFRDLKEFTSHLSNFKSLRNVQDSLINDLSSSSSSSAELARQPASTISSLANSITTTTTTTTTHPSASPASSSASHHPHHLTTTHPYQVQSELSANLKSNLIPTRASTSINACIPFLGLYLRDLTINDELPTYLDPTDPSAPAEIDESTGRLKKLANPKMLESLPKLARIEENHRTGDRLGEEAETNYYPLININKLRTYSKIVRKIIEFQDRTIKNYTFETDSKWFLTCLRIKCLSSDQLRRLSLTCEP